jgi:hypothetical protein
MPSPDEDFPSTSLDQPYDNSDYGVQPWENVDNPGTGSMAGDVSVNSGNNTYTGETDSVQQQGLPDAFGSYPGDPTYIGDDDDPLGSLSGAANGGLMGYADGGVSGSGSLDLRVPINVGGAGGGGGMSGGAGGFGGGYTPVGGGNGMTSTPSVNPNPSGGFGGGLAAMLGGGQPQQPAQQPMPLPAQMRNPYLLPEGEEEITWGVPDPDGMGGGTFGSSNPNWKKAAEWNRANQPAFDFSSLFGGGGNQPAQNQGQQPAQQELPVGYGEISGGVNNNNQFLANGGIAGYASGGMSHLGGYSDGGRLLRGPGDGVSDSIPASIGKRRQPARLADGEFVVPARIVSELGNGSTEAGARKLYAMMDRIQKARGKTVGKGKVAANPRAAKYLPA